ncbi:uncharacterized protein LOC128870007 [Anastrepha ludens]|uniref:uncharacterized protein LOC128870007 n=1 Tax=Anastrepha ludens TaxID=28586 RepID=UPI0023B1365D|nr:uncharacterized protein LOC128870007 [Anastrepha ludens]
MSSLLHQQLTLEKLLETIPHSGAVLPPSPALSPVPQLASTFATLPISSNTSRSATLTAAGNPAPSEQPLLWTDTTQMTAVKTLTPDGTDYVVAATVSKKSNESSNTDNGKNISSDTSKLLDSKFLAFDLILNDPPVVHGLQKPKDMNDCNNLVASTLLRSQLQLTPATSGPEKVVPPSSITNTNKLNVIGISRSAVSDEHMVHVQHSSYNSMSTTRSIRGQNPHSRFKREFKAESVPPDYINHHQQKQYLPSTEVGPCNETELAAKSKSITNTLSSANTKPKNIVVSSTDSLYESSEGDGQCVADIETEDTSPYLYDEVLNDRVSSVAFKHLPPSTVTASDTRLEQAPTSESGSIEQKNINHTEEAVSEHNLFLPTNDLTEPTTAIIDKKSQLLARLFATDLVIPRCYQRLNAYSSPSVCNRSLHHSLFIPTELAGDALEHRTNSRITSTNADMNGIVLEKDETDTAMPAPLKANYLRPMVSTTEAGEQPASTAAFTLLTEIFLRQHDYQQQQKQRQQLLSSAANTANVMSNLQRDELSKLSVAVQPQSQQLQLPLQLPLSLSLPLPFLPILGNNNTLRTKNASYDIPAFLYGNPNREYKERTYVKTPPQTNEQQLWGHPEKQDSNQLLDTQLLCSRVLRTNASTLSDHLRKGEFHFIDYAPTVLKPSSDPSSTLFSTHSFNNNRNNLLSTNGNDSSNSSTSYNTLNLSSTQTGAFHSSTPSNLPTEITSDGCNRTTPIPSPTINNTKLNGNELLSAQEMALSEAQLHLDKFLELSKTFVELAIRNSSVELISCIVPLIKENMQQRKQLIDCIHSQVNQLKHQCASANIYCERAMRRRQLSEIKLQSQARQRTLGYISNKIATASAIAATAAAAESHPLPPPLYIKTELMHQENVSESGKSEADDKEYGIQSAINTKRTLVEIEDGIERYVKAFFKQNCNESEVKNDENNVMQSKDNDEKAKDFIKSSNNKEENDFEPNCDESHEKLGRKQMPTFGTEDDVNTRLSPVSPICFWHPDNRGLSVNERALTTAEIILECAALAVQTNMRDPDAALNAMTESSFTTEREGRQMRDCNLEYTSVNRELFQESFSTAVTAAGISNTDLVLQFNPCNNTDGAGTLKGSRDKSPPLVLHMSAPTLMSSPIPSNTSTLMPTVTPVSTPITPPTPPLSTIGSTVAAKSRRKSNYARRIEATTTLTTAKHITKKNTFFGNQNPHTLIQHYSKNCSKGNVGDNNSGVKRYQGEQASTLPEKGFTNHDTSPKVASESTSAATINQNNLQQKKHYTLQKQPEPQQQHQNQFSGANDNSNNGIYGIHGSGGNTPNASATAAAAVVALQERAFTDIFKARFNALTAAAVMNATVSISAAAAAAAAVNATHAPDGPYDLSITKKSNQTNLDTKISAANPQGNECKDNSNEKKKPHIKKPLNAFMLYMKEMRAKVVAECTLKESAAINQILGRRWHELSRDDQSKYYEKARQERQLHMELYPGWSARDNYGYVSKKKKRKKDRSPADSGGNNMKKCRARFGLDQQNQWCKPCRY